ncbi:hypothetical protein ACFWFZ_10735 [Streptomyces sp. NPDC060232]|uniref:hypothetical protein n=1 Tax=Streptomyces sp. NPDC060232 TaxID=3347079 RepID=UPI00365432B9
MPMKTTLRITVAAATAFAALGIAAPQAAVADTPGRHVTVAPQASASTQSLVAANRQAAAMAANVCGAGYTQILLAERLPSATTRYATVYVYTNGKETGPLIYDQPTCAVLHNETGSAQYMGVRLKDNYTSTPDTQDFGTYSSYAGPVYQNKGYCGHVYSYMKKSGKVVVDHLRVVGSCN